MSKALLIIDMQKFVEDRIRQGTDYYPYDAIACMKRVVKQFRQSNSPVIHVRHQTDEPGSLLHPQSPFYPPVEAFEALASEPIFIKNTSSAFASTALKDYLDTHLISQVVVIGAVAGFCVNSTVRQGSDAGINMTVVKDAVISFGIPSAENGAKNIHDVTMALLEAAFCPVKTASELETPDEIS